MNIKKINKWLNGTPVWFGGKPFNRSHLIIVLAEYLFLGLLLGLLIGGLTI